MKTELLREFILLSQCGSFRAAAEKLFISQPTLSYHMKVLEQELGFELLDRSKNNELTEAGSLFLNSAQTALVALDAGMEECREIVKSHGYSLDPVRIQTCASINRTHDILEKYCEIPYKYIDYDMRKPTLYQFAQGQADIMICSYDLDITPSLCAEAKELGLAYGFFGLEQCAVAMKKSHPLAEVELTLENLRGAKVAILSVQNSGNWKSAIIEDILGSNPGFKYSLNPVSTPENFRTVDLKDMIYISLSHVIEDYFANRDGYVAKYTVDGERLFKRESILWRPEAENPQIESVARLLQQHACS